MSKHLLRAAEIAAMPKKQIQHQFNNNAIRLTRSLSTALGLQRLGLHLVTLERGRDSRSHHYHDADEEFIYIIAGVGLAKIGDQTFSVSAGDFMGFTAPSEPHSLHNSSSDDLVYLMGGESAPIDIVHYPDIGRSMTKSHGRRSYSDWDNIHEVTTRGR